MENGKWKMEDGEPVVSTVEPWKMAAMLSLPSAILYLPSSLS
jgi:hypothetical protein